MGYAPARVAVIGAYPEIMATARFSVRFFGAGRNGCFVNRRWSIVDAIGTKANFRSLLPHG
jgi:hypothetical protein